MSREPRALDLFCCPGGASRGLRAAGFEVVGVDIDAQPEHPGFRGVGGYTFVQADALTYPLEGFDLIWASPPCQAFTAYRRRKAHVAPAPNLIPPMRARLAEIRKRLPRVQTVMENVVGAPLEDAVMLCGSNFGLDVQRHRMFEASFVIPTRPCRHEVWTPRFPPATNRSNLRKTVEVGVWRIPLETQQKAMGIEGMSLGRLSQAIPPAFADHIGRAAMVAPQGTKMGAS